MANHEFVEFIAKGIADAYLKTKARESGQGAAALYRQTSELITAGNYEKASTIGTEAQTLFSYSQELQAQYQVAIEQLAPRIVQVLAEFGITEEIPSSFYYALIAPLQDYEPVETGPAPKVTARVPNGNDPIRPPVDLDLDPSPPERVKRKKDLTDIQYSSALITLRLLLPEKETASVNEALNEYVALKKLNEPDTEIDIKKMRLGMQNNREGAMGKLKERLEKFKEQRHTDMRFPIAEEDLATLTEFPLVVDIYQRINLIPAYQGMTIDELYEYTKTFKPISLQKSDVSNPDKGEDIVLQFTPNEMSYVAKILYSQDTQEKLTDQNKAFLVSFINWENEEISDDEKTQLQSGILHKLHSYYEGNETDKGNVFDAQSEDGQVLLAVTVNFWESYEDVTAALSLNSQN